MNISKALYKVLHHFINLIFHVLSFLTGSIDKSLDSVDLKVQVQKRHENGKTTTKEKPEEEIKLKTIAEMPGPISLPYFGTLFTSAALNSTDLYKSNEDRMRNYGPFVKECHLHGFPMIQILDADHIQQLLKNLGTIRPGIEIMSMYRMTRPDKYDSPGITNTQGAVWEALHAAFNPIFQSGKLINSMVQANDEMAQDVTDLVRKSVQNSQENFEAFELLEKWVAETAFFNVLGKRLGFIEDNVSETFRKFYVCHEKVFSTFNKSAYTNWWKYFPTKMWKEFTQSDDYMVDVIEEIMQEAIANEGEMETLGLIKEMLNAKGASHADKRLVIMETIMGATVTMLNTCIFSMYLISRNKSVVAKLREELRQILPSKDSTIDLEAIGKMKYLKACIKEAFRVATVAPALHRVTDKEYQIGGYTIPKYVLVVPHFWYAGLQDTSFYKAKEFLPERWIYGEDGTPPFKPHKEFLLLHFGTGKRMCIGRRLAKQNLTIFLAKIFRNFDVTFNQEIELVFDWLLRVKSPVSISFKDLLED